MDLILPNSQKNFVMVICGSRRSGKSHFIKHKLLPKYLEEFNAVYIISPSDDFNDIQLNENSGKFDIYNVNLIEQLFESQQEIIKIDPEYRILILLDDCISGKKFKQESEENILNKIATRGRHFNISLIATTQKHKSIAGTIRYNSDLLIWFDLHTVKMLYEERPITSSYKHTYEIGKVALENQYNHMIISSFFKNRIFYWDNVKEKYFQIKL